jgi:hypothetical protein
MDDGIAIAIADDGHAERPRKWYNNSSRRSRIEWLSPTEG